MYLRHTTIRKDGKVHRYWRVVRSVRVGRRVIQQTVAQLGELDEQGRLQARALAHRLIGTPERAQLFDDGSEQLTVSVRLKGIRIERPRQFGDVYLALALWRGTGLEGLCERLLPIGKERIAWSKMAAVLVTARFCEPSSELHIAEDWYRRTALSDLLQLDDEEVNKDRLYRGLDHLLTYKSELEAHLSQRCGELFATQNEVLLYDVTSTYFEGQAAVNPQAQRGYSRDHRPDCKQVCIALVVTFDGFPLGYEVFAGNTHDSRTLQTIVATMEARHGMLGRVWITDRGMASADNLAWLRQTGRRYIIGAPKSELKKFAFELARSDGWRMVHEGVEVKLTRHSETGETVILCRSADRRSKERAMHDKFSRRIEEALGRLAARLARSKKRIDPATVNRQIGRILQQNQRSAARFAITLEPDGCPAGFRLGVVYNAAFDDWAALSEGAYLLRSNICDWSDQQLWKAYIQLTQAEAAFRIQKDQLNLRPIWHQREDRVQAHILVCFLAFVLWKSLEMWQSRAGLGNSPRIILEELKRIQSQDVVLPTAAHGQIRLRCVTQPDPAQAALLNRLGIVLPKRMRLAQQHLPALEHSA
ncbi:Transposase [Bradyrhizobium erythrophlei]|jgi:transposase|nr:Transposase [Bradyrhizobium erythrophlei]SIO13352.1 Transposase [Bradyrhizobium erythrophlei]SIO51828.1 Transposase [Bradyrhizobium erythrophlei]